MSAKSSNNSPKLSPRTSQDSLEIDSKKAETLKKDFFTNIRKLEEILGDNLSFTDYSYNLSDDFLSRGEEIIRLIEFSINEENLSSKCSKEEAELCISNAKLKLASLKRILRKKQKDTRDLGFNPSDLECLLSISFSEEDFNINASFETEFFD
jgi:hypothetical protein